MGQFSLRMDSQPLSWRHRHCAFLSVAAIVGLVLVTHVQSLDNFFWLDDFHILQSAMNAARHPADLFYDRLTYGFFRPLASAGCLLFYKLFGLNPFPYHLGSMLTHAANGCLIAMLAWMLVRDHAVALVAGALFAVHRSHTIPTFHTLGGISELLGIFFYLSCVIAYLYSLQTARRRYYVLAFVAFILAMLTKEIAVSLLPTLVLCDVLLVPSPDAADTGWYGRLLRIARRQIPFILLFLVYAGYQAFFVQSSDSLFYRDLLAIEPDARTTHAQDFTPLRIGLRFISHIFDYLVSLVFPIEGGGYQSTHLPFASAQGAIALIRDIFRYGMLVLIPIIWITGNTTTRFLLVWTLLSCIPTALLYYLIYYRLVYTASAGFSILFAIIALQLYRTARTVRFRTIFAGLLAVFFIGHSALTINDERLMDYRGQLYRTIIAEIQSRYPHLDDATTLYIIDGPGEIEQAIQVFYHNTTFIIRRLSSGAPQSWPAVKLDHRHLLFRVTPTGVVEQRAQEKDQ